MQMLTQTIEKSSTRIDFNRVIFPVNFQADVDCILYRTSGYVPGVRFTVHILILAGL